MLGLVLVVSASATYADNLYYQGKTIRIVVGFSAGGGFDTSARTIARHIVKYIPGTPSIIVENMTGAGSLIAANHTYSKAKADGLTVGYFIGGLLLQEAVGAPGIAFDSRKFEYLGAHAPITPVCVFTRASGIASFDHWVAAKSKPPKIGALAPGDNTFIIAKVVEATLGLPMHLVSGHKGIPDVKLAAERGEVAGLCSALEVVRILWGDALDTGDLRVVLQLGAKRLPELGPVAHIEDYVKAADARELISVAVQHQAEMTYLFALPPGTPAEPVRILREAFMKTVRDPEFVADAKKARMTVDPIPAEELQRIVADVHRMSPVTKEKLRPLILRQN
jgi:tripartite-type tricarboxylate transporter receptor subunit TctC